MVTPFLLSAANSRARFVCVISSVHAKQEGHDSCFFKADEVGGSRADRPLCLSGMRKPRGSGRGGQLWGAKCLAPIKYGYRESEASGADPLRSVRSTNRARVSVRVTRDIAERNSYVSTYGHSDLLDNNCAH